MVGLEGLRILVTGGAGFIGSHIVETLVRQGAEVVVFDNLSSGSKENLKHLGKKVTLVTGDILDYEKILDASDGIDVISHQAAQLEITRCIDDPIEDLNVNAVGSLNVFNAAVKNHVQKVIYASSACIYGQARCIPESENHPHAPNWPYGVSKLAVEKYADIYQNYHKLTMVGLRYSIIYGPREWYGRVLTVFLKRALEGQPPVIWGGDQVRDFCHVTDVIAFHNLIVQRDEIDNNVFNVSTGIGTTISELANMVVDIFGLDPPTYEELPEGATSNAVAGRMRLPLELRAMVLDNSRAKKLGWEPRIGLQEGLIDEYSWIEKNVHRWQSMSY